MPTTRYLRYHSFVPCRVVCVAMTHSHFCMHERRASSQCSYGVHILLCLLLDYSLVIGFLAAMLLSCVFVFCRSNARQSQLSPTPAHCVLNFYLFILCSFEAEHAAKRAVQEKENIYFVNNKTQPVGHRLTQCRKKPEFPA